MLISHFWHSLDGIHLRAISHKSVQATILCNEFESYTFEINGTFPKSQWVKFVVSTVSIEYDLMQSSGWLNIAAKDSGISVECFTQLLWSSS